MEFGVDTHVDFNYFICKADQLTCSLNQTCIFFHYIFGGIYSYSSMMRSSRISRDSQNLFYKGYSVFPALFFY